MISNSLFLTITTLGWLFGRASLTWWFCNSDYQAYVLLFAMATVWLDIYVCKYLANWGQTIQDEASGLGKDGTLANKFILAALGWSVLASPFCASVVLIHSESATGSHAPYQGVVSFDEARALPDESCFEVTGAAPFIWYLGAVEYSVGRRSEKFYYAAPLESADWDPSREVRLWAIVEESELSQGVLSHNKTALRIPAKNAHYSAFQAAVSNAESRFDLKSAKDVILVRLLNSPEAAAPAYGGQNVWIGLLYGLSVILALLYPAVLVMAPKKRKLLLSNQQVNSIELGTSPSSTAHMISKSQQRALIAKRRFWLGLHVFGVVALSILMINWLTDIWPLLLVLVVPALELWLLIRAFPHPETRRSLRMAATWLLPVSMLLALVLVNVGKFSLEEAKRYDSQMKWSQLDANNTNGTIVAMPEDLVLRKEWTGSYWAPNEETTNWRAVPLVTQTWAQDQPIKYWLKSTDRLDGRFLDAPPKYVRVLNEQNTFQIRQAIADAEYHHGIVADEVVIILEPVIDPEKQTQEAIGFIALGFLCVSISWAVCAAYWPISRSLGI